MVPVIAARESLDVVRQLADPDPPWQAVLQAVQRLVGADCANFVLFDRGQVSALEQIHVSAAVQHDYEAHFHKEDIFLQPGVARPVGAWLDSEEVLPAHERHRNAYFTDFMLRHRLRQMLTFVIEDGPYRSAALSVHRESVLADAGEHLRSEAVQGFGRELQKALARRRQASATWLESVEAAFDTFGEGACLAMANGSLIWHSANFDALVGEPPVLRRRQHQLTHADPKVHESLQRGLQRASAGAGPVHLALPGQGASSLHLEMVRAAPMLGFGVEHCVLVRLRRTQAQSVVSPESLALAFRLSTAESRVLAALAAGQTPGDYAQAQGLSVHTVRKHIANLMSKMRCSRHADAIRMALAVAHG